MFASFMFLLIFTKINTNTHFENCNSTLKIYFSQFAKSSAEENANSDDKLVDDDNLLDMKIDSYVQSGKDKIIDPSYIVKEFVLDTVTNNLVEVTEPEKDRKSKKARVLRTADYDLKGVLTNHPVGAALIKRYELHQRFRTIDEHHLVNITALDLIKNYGE